MSVPRAFSVGMLMVVCVPVRASSPPPSWRNVDQALSQANDAQAVFVRCMGTIEDSAAKNENVAAPSTATVAACQTSCSMETVLADRALKSRLFSDVVLRQACMAVALNSPAPCVSLADVPGEPETGQRMCRRLFAMSLFSKELILGVANNEACEAWCLLAPAPPPPALIGRVCEALGHRDYHQACSEIENWKTTPDHGYNIRECDWEMQSLLGMGGEEFCGRQYRPGSDVCVATALYKKAVATSDPTLCGANPLCRAMLGEGRAACVALDAGIEAQARAIAAPAGGARRSPQIDVAALNLECVRARSGVLRQLYETRRLLASAGRDANAGITARQTTLSRLEVRQKDLEAGYMLRSGMAASHRPVAVSSYAGAWAFYNTPKKATGCCRSGSEYLSKEKAAGSITIDSSGRFLFFSGNVSMSGAVAPFTGNISGIITDPLCGEGKITGRCLSPTRCSGSYSQSSGAGADGVVNSESGDFRLAR